MAHLKGLANKFHEAEQAFVAPVKDVVPSSKHGKNGESGTSSGLSGAFIAPVKAIEKGGKAITKEGEKIVKVGKKSLSKGEEGATVEEVWEDAAAPPDATLHNMNVIITKRLKGVSVKNFYETVWSEGNRTDKPPFYRPWLEADKDKQNISVEDWTFADATPGQKIVADWDGEEYSQKRVVKLRFNRSAFTADVTDTHYCRVEEDRCILAMSVKTEGVPFADCFVLEIRWVATRVGKNDLLIEVGMFVNFSKSTMLASKIKSESTSETRKGQLDLFEAIKGACGADVEEVVVALAPEEKPFTCSALGEFLSQLLGELLGRPRGGILSTDVELGHDVLVAERKMKKVRKILQAKEDLPAHDKDIVRVDIHSVNELLDEMLSSVQ